ncbi:MAG: polyprenyl synthetase family protein [Elusimicrobiota bacterium]
MIPTLPAVEETLERVRARMGRRAAGLGSRIGDPLSAHVARPGKMLRARYALLLGAALDAAPEVSERTACVAELVHNASLLHDDCIDNGTLRRGAPTPNAEFGDKSGVLLGNLAFTEAMDEAFDLPPGAARALAAAVREMAAGALQEEFLRGSLNVSAEGYFGLAARKTGSLFEWIGLALAGGAAQRRLGRSAGILLQIVDDVHDFTLDSDRAGKDAGQDFANGRLTLPCILALDDEGSRGRFLEAWSRRGSPGAFEDARRLLQEGGYLEQASGKAREVYERMLPWVPEKAGSMREFLRQMLEREF